MLKKNYFYLLIASVAMVYNSVQLIFYPEFTPIWFIRLMGGFFVICAIGYLLDIQKLYLQNRIDKLSKKLDEIEFPQKT